MALNETLKFPIHDRAMGQSALLTCKIKTNQRLKTSKGNCKVSQGTETALSMLADRGNVVKYDRRRMYKEKLPYYDSVIHLL